VTPAGAPTQIRKESLLNPGLVYSGIYTDGWMSKNARVRLAGGTAGILELRALVVLPGGQHLHVTVDGRPISSYGLKPGEADLRMAISASRSARTIELRWSTTARLAPNDPRQAAALLRSISVFLPH
jgi:hypothetical protein